MRDAGTTWAGTHRFGALGVVEASTVAQVQEAVRTAPGRVKALGTRHSFNDIADTDGTLVTVTGIDGTPFIDVTDPSHPTVTTPAGIRYGVLGRWLQERGWALHNTGSLPHISLAGATATGTHGSGVLNGCQSTALSRIEFVDAGGDLCTIRHMHPEFPAVAVGVGAFGIITELSLTVQPTYDVRQDVYVGLPWEVLLDHARDVLADAYSVSIFTTWTEDTVQQIWRKSGVRAGAEPPDEWWGATRQAVGDTRLVDGDPGALTPQGIPGPWIDRLPHFRLTHTPSNGEEIQTEYFVPMEAAGDALAAVRALGDRIVPHLLVSELRAVAADDLWLSGAYGRETLAIHFTWAPHPEPVRALLPEIERALAPFDARPHWGKWHAFDGAAIARVTPRLADARAVFETLDPAGRFVNDYLTRLGIREPRAPRLDG
ncbi:D-arabinono-1,4-lactone oxidase [Demequina lignilytica]|uniref:D-arabinono-1,4-lactone oxidase n=1 Tax=Demequina lignilytica TaxID=3051663 RepID=A0AB35MGJ0_9MICO|nr:D-arabinono-1,4-lactone oxidase [Demequina sp. SYSU T0a273]MDN4482889.1 D-arabinono-1,4-lactone oxidase [Demequina sp. SYSU T0a273]